MSYNGTVRLLFRPTSLKLALQILKDLRDREIMDLGRTMSADLDSFRLAKALAEHEFHGERWSHPEVTDDWRQFHAPTLQVELEHYGCFPAECLPPLTMISKRAPAIQFEAYWEGEDFPRDAGVIVFLNGMMRTSRLLVFGAGHNPTDAEVLEQVKAAREWVAMPE